MLIASIIITSILVISFICFFLLKDKLDDKEVYELKTTTSKGNIIFSYVFFVLGLALSIASLIITLVMGEQPYCIVLMAFGGSFGLLGIFLLFELRAEYEAIRGNVVYIKRFLKKREIPIKNIVGVSFTGNLIGYTIVETNGEITSISRDTVGVKELLDLINKRIESPLTIEEEFEPTIEEVKEKEALKTIGKEFRENSDSLRKKQKRSLIIGLSALIIFVIVVIIITGMYESWWAVLIFILMCSPIFALFIIAFRRLSITYVDELSNDDEWLGYKHRFDNHKVIGYAKNKFKTILPAFISIMVLSLVIGGASIYQTSLEPIPQSQLIEVTGEFEYIRTSSGYLKKEIAIGLKDDDTEYRIGDNYSSYFDSTFKETISKGDIITISIDKNRSPDSMNEEGRTKYNYAYTVRTNNKAYFTYDDYMKGFNLERIKSYIFFGCSIAAFTISSIGIIVSTIIYKKRAKEETIKID